MINNYHQMTKLKQYLLLFLLCVAIIIGIAIFSYLSSHGRLNIQSDIFDRAILTRIDTAQSVDLTSPSRTLQSGTYQLIVHLSNQSIFKASITIHPWLKTTTVDPVYTQLDPELIAAYTHENTLPISNTTFLAYDRGNQSAILPETASTNLPIHCIEYARSTSTSLLTFGTDCQAPAPLVYSYAITSGVTTQLSLPSDQTYSRVGSTTDLYLYSDAHAFFHLSPSGATQVPLDLSNLPPSPLAYFGQQSYVLLPRQTASSPDPGLKKDDTALIDIIARIYSATDHNTLLSSINLGKDPDITDVALSPDEDRLAIITDFDIRIFDLTTQQLIFSVTSEHHAENFAWQSNDIFYYIGEFSTIYAANISHLHSYSILTPHTLRSSKIHGNLDNYLYFTAFDPLAESSTPNSYRLKLD